MLPIFKEYRSMLKSFGVDLASYDEDKLWVDRLIIRGIDKNGKDRKICRLKVTDDLVYEYKFYDKTPTNEELMNWEESYKFYENEILQKEQESLDVIRDAIKKYPECQLFVSTSMGKDSQLTEHLVKKITTNYRVLFNNTTCDSADVYKQVKARPEIEILTPKDKNGNNLSLYRMADKNGFATRHHRWCCGIFKEGGVKEYLKDEKNIIQFLGMRNEESFTRKDYQFEKIDDRFDKSWHLFLPIRKWKELELWLYTIYNNLPINSKYYKGYSRVGCHIVCPFYTSSTWILDRYWYQNQHIRFQNQIKEWFVKTESWCWFNGTIEEFLITWNNGAIRLSPTKEVIQEFMQYKGLTDENVALQYFNKTCIDCGKKVYKKDEVAMNLKYFGRTINKFKCKKCLMKDFGWTKEDWNKQVEDFKAQGCKLF